MKDMAKLEKMFGAYASGRSLTEAFNGMLDFLTVPLKLHDTETNRRQAIEGLAKVPNARELFALAAEIGERSEGFQDPLGALYERLISKGQNGQYFTPDPVAEFMARITVPGDVDMQRSVMDPACGSGRMLLAAARENRHLRFYGADIDPVCCKMALVKMLLNSLTGEIAHMNSLSSEFHRGYRTGTFLRDGYHYPWYVEFTDPEKSAIWQQPGAKASPQGFSEPFEPKPTNPVQGVQGTLF